MATAATGAKVVVGWESYTLNHYISLLLNFFFFILKLFLAVLENLHDEVYDVVITIAKRAGSPLPPPPPFSPLSPARKTTNCRIGNQRIGMMLRLAIP